MLYLIIFAFLIVLSFGIICFINSPKLSFLTKYGSIIAIILSTILLSFLYLPQMKGEQNLFNITDTIRVFFKVDNLGCFFATVFQVAFILVCIFKSEYFNHDERKNRFDAFFLFSDSALILLCFAGNLITMYITFECVTLFSMPLVLHDKTKESIDASIKYLLYSIGGAFLGFIGIVYFSMNISVDSFSFGGVLADGVKDSKAFPVILLLMLIGFGAKCGLFPLHNWLPTAHPVAPAPASAMLSGLITKSGVVAIIRIVYYTIGAEAIRGTWAHTVWLILILITILLGSFMAAVQKNIKKRFAFSTVSQVSYILLGIACLDTDGLSGSILQIVSHAVIKICLFLVAGSIIHLLNKHDVDEIDGIGHKMPITMWSYTICALGLIGVPPTSGFVAKWYLAQGALESGLGAFSVIAPIVLIKSAILTAYYLMSITIKAFFPSDKTCDLVRIKEPAKLTIPCIILAVLTVLLGIFANPIANLVNIL